MCKNITALPDGTEIRCRECWQCKRERAMDWIGRCIAESTTAVASSAVTLTYGRDMHTGAEDHIRSVVLTFSDVQKYVKKLRAARGPGFKDGSRPQGGYPVRYVAVGEYGSRKQRAHWHLLLFWLERVPPHQLRERFAEAHWEHGVSYWDACDTAAVRYVCKYLLKGDGKSDIRFAMSKKPVIGADYFRQLADRHVEAGLAPQDLRYTFDAARDRRGRLMRFALPLRSATADLFLARYVERWRAVHGTDRNMPNSELVEDWLDRQLKASAELRFEPRAVVVRRPEGSDLRWFMEPARVRFSETLNAWYYDHEGGQARWYWCLGEEGKPQWQSELGRRSEQFARSGSPSYSDQSRGT